MLPNILHSSHLGITRTRRRAPECMYGSNIINDIKDFISQSKTCRSMEVTNAKMPLTPHDILDRPWSKVRVDLFTLNNINYLILVDYFSGYFEVDDLRDTLRRTIIRKSTILLDMDCLTSLFQTTDPNSHAKNSKNLPKNSILDINQAALEIPKLMVNPRPR